MVMDLPRALPVFSAAFIVLYLVATHFNLALFTYHPVQGELEFLTQPAKGGAPAMYWYGWMTTAALGAAVLAALSLAVPDRLAARVWPGWTPVIAVVVMLAFVYLLQGWFLPSIRGILK
jgi:hypothetical protein